MTCGADNRWGGCVRTVDTVRNDLRLDVCNSIDDDCDDTIDEDCNPGGGEPCAPGQTRDPNTNLCVCAGSCPFGGHMNQTTCLCDSTCGDGICSADESALDCAIDCDDGGGSSCICGWDCPPNDPACAGFCGDGVCDLVAEDSVSCPADCDLGGGGGFCGDDLCGDWDFWDWYVDAYGWDEAMDAYEWFCAV
jgi:hypothetical protein